VKLVITLKSGVQIKADVDSFTTTSNKISGELRGIRWEASGKAGTSVNWLDLAEVAAVHAEHEPGDTPDDPGYVGAKAEGSQQS
jgi:hypothetical protein